LSVTLTTAGTDEAAQQQKINEGEKDTNFSSDEEVTLETSALLNLRQLIFFYKLFYLPFKASTTVFWKIITC